MPLLVFHDVCWPLARRDQYAAPDRIPEEHRHPYGEDIKLVPGQRGHRGARACPSSGARSRRAVRGTA